MKHIFYMDNLWIDIIDYVISLILVKITITSFLINYLSFEEIINNILEAILETPVL